MDELQAGVEQALTVLPQPPALLEPSKAALDDPTLRHDLEGMQFAAFGNLHRDVIAQDLAHRLREGLAHLAAVGQHALHLPQARLAALERLQRPLAIGHVRSGHRHGMRQALRVHGNMALDARHLLARVITLLSGGIRVLYALRVHDQERRAGVALLSGTGRANLIFLMPAPARSHRADQAGSIC